MLWVDRFHQQLFTSHVNSYNIPIAFRYCVCCLAIIFQLFTCQFFSVFFVVDVPGINRSINAQLFFTCQFLFHSLCVPFLFGQILVQCTIAGFCVKRLQTVTQRCHLKTKKSKLETLSKRELNQNFQSCFRRSFMCACMNVSVYVCLMREYICIHWQG